MQLKVLIWISFEVVAAQPSKIALLCFHQLNLV